MQRPLGKFNNFLFIFFLEVKKIYLKVVLTNFNCENNVWKFYSSLNGKCYRESMKLILDMFSELDPETDFMVLENKDVQIQKGVNDCGLFSVAWVFSLANGEDPSQLNYKQASMRKHFNKCVTDQCFTDFPATALRKTHFNHSRHIYDCKLKKFQ